MFLFPWILGVRCHTGSVPLRRRSRLHFQDGFQAFRPAANGIPIAVIAVRKNTERDRNAEKQRIPAERQAAEIEHPGKHALAQRLHERTHGATQPCTAERYCSPVPIASVMQTVNIANDLCLSVD